MSCFQGEATKGEPEVVYDADSFAAQLLKHGSDPNATEPESGKILGRGVQSIVSLKISVRGQGPVVQN